jgi:outer membrane protein assembly factor BamE (lipoprotein component of BamABCDE complex)
MYIYQSINRICVFSLCLLAAACALKVDNRGYVPGETVMDRITVGRTTQEEILNALGSPSTRSSFGADAWYYVSSRKEATAFLKPEITEQKVTRIEFDAAGAVSGIESYDVEDGEDIALVKRETPTEGHSLGFFEQILGNVGRFNRPDNDSIAKGRQPN